MTITKSFRGTVAFDILVLLYTIPMVHAPVTDPCNRGQGGHVLFTCKAKPRAIASNKEPVDTTFYRKYLGNSDFRAISV